MVETDCLRTPCRPSKLEHIPNKNWLATTYQKQNNNQEIKSYTGKIYITNTIETKQVAQYKYAITGRRLQKTVINYIPGTEKIQEVSDYHEFIE